MTTFHALARRALPALALLALAACTAAEASAPVQPPAYTAHPAMVIVDRLEGTGGLPDLTGNTAEEAARLLATFDLSVQVIAFDEGPVSAQYPEPGAPAPSDGLVVVWTGEPPVPAPPPPRPAPDQEPATVPEAVPAADQTADRAEPVEEVDEVDPDPVATRSEAPVQIPQTPHPPRTNPRYLPETAPGTVLAGPASWYGDKFAGKTTACGGVFDPEALTLATRDLRCGTRVQITGPTGATVEAVATDWGPAEWTQRGFDLSRATFAAIHPLGAGVVNVTVEVLP